MLTAIARGLLFRVLGYGALVLGFWLLLQGFQQANIPLGILGGALIPGGMYLLVLARRRSRTTGASDSDGDHHGGDIDSVD